MASAGEDGAGLGNGLAQGANLHGALDEVQEALGVKGLLLEMKRAALDASTATS